MGLGALRILYWTTAWTLCIEQNDESTNGDYLSCWIKNILTSNVSDSNSPRTFSAADVDNGYGETGVQAGNIATIHCRIDRTEPTFLYGADQIFAGWLTATTGFESAVTQKIPNLCFDVINGHEWRRSLHGEPLVKRVKSLNMFESGGPASVKKHRIKERMVVD